MILDGKQIKKMSPVTGLIYGKHDIEEEKTYSKGSWIALYLKMTLKFPLTHFSIKMQK